MRVASLSAPRGRPAGLPDAPFSQEPGKKSASRGRVKLATCEIGDAAAVLTRRDFSIDIVGIYIDESVCGAVICYPRSKRRGDGQMAEQEGETPSRGGPHWPHWIRFDRFSWLDLGVFAVSEGVALPLCIAAGDAFVHRDWIGAAIGWGPGLPLFVFGVAFPFSRHWLRPETRELFQRRAINWAPVVISLAFLYVVGPAIVRRTVPSSPTSDEIAKTVAREIKPLLAKQSRPQPTVAPQPDLVKNILIYPDDNNFSVFRCEFNTSSAGKRMRIFLDYEFRGMSETTWSKMVRFPLYDLRDYFRDQKASFVVLRRHQYQSSYKTKQFTAWDFRFGDDKAPEDNSSYILGIEYRTRLAFVNKNGDEQYNYFYILNWKDAHNAETFKPKIVTTDIISPMLNWSGQRGQARGLAPASP